MIGSAVTAFVVTSIGMLAVLPLVARAKLVDVPNARSSHMSPTPRAGGLAVLLGIFAGVLVGKALNLSFEPWLLVAMLVFAIVGLVDDFRGLAVWPRLLAQGATSLLLALSLLGWSGFIVLVLVGLSTVWLVSYTNAFNFMDGINGISGLNAALAGAWYTYLGITRDIDVLVGLGATVAAAAVGFLPWNIPRARVFLGDTGSYSLGIAIGGLALLAWHNGSSLIAAIAPLSVYLADTGWTLLKRIARGSSWREAHREHTYQRLADGFGSHLGSAIIVASTGVLALLAPYLNAPAHVSTLAITLVVVAYLALPRVTLLFGLDGQFP